MADITDPQNQPPQLSLTILMLAMATMQPTPRIAASSVRAPASLKMTMTMMRKVAVSVARLK